jgi:hypothetical protein
LLTFTCSRRPANGRLSARGPVPGAIAELAPFRYPVSVATSWSVAFERLAADDPPALQLLTLVAWLSPLPVPLTLLTQHPQQLPEPLADAVRDPLAVADWTAALRRRGLARTTPDSLQVHRVPAALLRARTTGDLPDSGGWAATAVRLLRQAAPENPWNNVAVWPAWRRLLPHILAVTDPTRHLDIVVDDVVWLLRHASLYMTSRGEPRTARPLAQRAHDLSRNRLGEDHPDTMTAASNLAITVRWLGDYEHARQLDEDTLTRRRRVLGDDHPGTLHSATNLAVNLRRLGQHEQARRLDDDTLIRRRRLLGDDHPDTMQSANNLAADLRRLREPDQARRLTEDTLTRRRRVLGDSHPDTLQSANNFAADLRRLAKYEHARRLDQDTLARRRQILGNNHPDTLTSARNLAEDLRLAGEQDARALGEDKA